MQGHHQNHHQQLSSASATSSNGNFMNKDGYDLGEIDPSLFLYLDGQGHHDPPSTAPLPHHHTNQNLAMRPPTSTLNIFPSQPMHIEPPPSSTPNKEGNRKGPASSDYDIPKSSDPKNAIYADAMYFGKLRQAYVQQLESCRIKLTQLEQEIQRARSQGVFYGGSLMGGDQQQGGMPIGPGYTSSEAAVFDMEYTRWLEEQQRLLTELRVATQEHLAENELRMFVDTCLAHYDHLINLKAM
ncbi:hypothetical protein BRARA_K01142, partial [Brassica rapa]